MSPLEQLRRLARSTPVDEVSYEDYARASHQAERLGDAVASHETAALIDSLISQVGPLLPRMGMQRMARAFVPEQVVEERCGFFGFGKRRRRQAYECSYLLGVRRLPKGRMYSVNPLELLLLTSDLRLYSAIGRSYDSVRGARRSIGPDIKVSLTSVFDGGSSDNQFEYESAPWTPELRLDEEAFQPREVLLALCQCIERAHESWQTYAPADEVVRALLKGRSEEA